MSNDRNPSIETLPVELLHRVFDNLDTETILFSIRPVSRLFQSIVNTYNRYDLNFHLISKSVFHVLCRLINPEHVISLTLSNDYRTPNQIDLFLSLFNLKQFTRLRSLRLLHINDSQLNIVLKDINLSGLTFFSLKDKDYNDQSIGTATNDLLWSAISKATLRRLELDPRHETIRHLSWPMNCTIQHLTIDGFINLDDLCQILQCFPSMNTLIVKYILTGDRSLPSIGFPQITSLTINGCHSTMDELELFLQLTPALLHLKLIDVQEMVDGNDGKNFLQRNLPQLEKFEFYFSKPMKVLQPSTDLQLILTSFQTPFWIEHKKWFVQGEFHIHHSPFSYFYSLPICKSSFNYVPKSGIVSFSTSPLTMDNDLSRINHIKSLSFRWETPIVDDIREKETITNDPLFPNVNDIQLHFSKDWPSLSLQSLSVFLDISRLVQIKLCSEFFDQFNLNAWTDLGNFLAQAQNLSSLIIQSELYVYQQCEMRNNIYTILPRGVKHLGIPLVDLEKLKIILQRCENLSTIAFRIDNREFAQKAVSWFADNTINTTCQERYRTVSVWLGQTKSSIK